MQDIPSTRILDLYMFTIYSIRVASFLRIKKFQAMDQLFVLYENKSIIFALILHVL